MRHDPPPGATVSIQVVPGSSRNRVVGRHGDGFKVTVSAPPEDGRANQAVYRLLADFLGVKPARVRVMSGQARRLKVVRIDGLAQADVDARLESG